MQAKDPLAIRDATSAGSGSGATEPVLSLIVLEFTVNKIAEPIAA